MKNQKLKIEDIDRDIPILIIDPFLDRMAICLKFNFNDFSSYGEALKECRRMLDDSVSNNPVS